ncbi:hypothetical protein LQ948_15335 [Jiella sp. MQZ9-1]|uniref:Uncharacterized protein n=1 Tax=Jiella flava TaxID=2816857 RepID=A0A939G2H3_9HYPH|nr:hypothetical protein [Jiella flava]MBO0664007.1 hypothetical protein [Jiella flava]MCD2472578.1 hypothetical protein [Jiella flava]
MSLRSFAWREAQRSIDLPSLRFFIIDFGATVSHQCDVSVFLLWEPKPACAYYLRKGEAEMEHVAAFMLLVGCSGDISVCKEIPVPSPAYETVAACQQDLPLQIRLSNSSDSRVLGACKAVSEDVFQQSASLDWSVSRNGQLAITFETEPSLVASR